MTVNISSPSRSKLSRAAALADRAVLLALIEDLCPLPPFEYIREPQRGLLMIRGRIGATGQPFNLGEALATRCSVKIRGTAGHGYCLGDDPPRALATALLDALASVPAYSSHISKIHLLLEDSVRALNKAAFREALKTRVEFFTLIRGENDD
jgi:alpha-D-ribose 1-methylphosphonate 5-triphosphate synthase subunit PhnG